MLAVSGNLVMATTTPVIVYSWVQNYERRVFMYSFDNTLLSLKVKLFNTSSSGTSEVKAECWTILFIIENNIKKPD